MLSGTAQLVCIFPDGKDEDFFRLNGEMIVKLKMSLQYGSAFGDMMSLGGELSF